LLNPENPPYNGASIWQKICYTSRVITTFVLKIKKIVIMATRVGWEKFDWHR